MEDFFQRHISSKTKKGSVVGGVIVMHREIMQTSDSRHGDCSDVCRIWSVVRECTFRLVGRKDNRISSIIELISGDEIVMASRVVIHVWNDNSGRETFVRDGREVEFSFPAVRLVSSQACDCTRANACVVTQETCVTDYGGCASAVHQVGGG